MRFRARPAGPLGSGVNGARRRRWRGPTRTMRGVLVCPCDFRLAIGTPGASLTANTSAYRAVPSGLARRCALESPSGPNGPPLPVFAPNGLPKSDTREDVMRTAGHQMPCDLPFPRRGGRI